MLTDRFNEALAYAERAHRTQKRKGSDVPYVDHLRAVCAFVLENAAMKIRPLPRCCMMP